LAELDKIEEIWPHPFIEFADDNSFVDKSYWKELLPRLKDRSLRWFAETDVSVAEDPELLCMMRESGCAQILVGFESPTRDSLDGLETRSNWKYHRWPHYKEAIDVIQSHGISVNGCFVLGLDGHDAGVFDTVFEFVKDSELSEVQVTLQTAFPSTALYARLKNEDRLLEPEAWNKLTLFDVNFVPQNMSVKQLEAGFRNLVARLYSDESTRFRRDKFRQYLRRAPAYRRNRGVKHREAD
jgi:radical SAM superfamily enzyme YgiQ (UPF0313 family)